MLNMEEINNEQLLMNIKYIYLKIRLYIMYLYAFPPA